LADIYNLQAPVRDIRDAKNFLEENARCEIKNARCEIKNARCEIKKCEIKMRDKNAR